jgi:hypothetical protein
MSKLDSFIVKTVPIQVMNLSIYSVWQITLKGLLPRTELDLQIGNPWDTRKKFLKIGGGIFFIP